MAGFFSTIARFVIFAVNFLFMFLGGWIFVSGIRSHMQENSKLISEIGEGNLFLIITGAIVFLISFIGCFGAFKEDSCLLRTYSIIILILFIAQLTGFFFVYKNADQIKNAVESHLKKAVEHYGDGTDPQLQKWIDEVQNVSLCCGVNGPDDYKNATVPASCCKPEKIQNDTCAKTDANEIGCLKAVEEAYATNYKIIKWVLISILSFQFLAITISCCLANSIRRQYDVV